MAWRLTDISIRTRLYSLLVLGTVAGVLTLGFAIYLLNVFRIGGERHLPAKLKRELRTEISPPTIYLVELYLVLQEMETATREDDVRAHKEAFETAVKSYDDALDQGLKELNDERLKRKLDNDVGRSGKALIDAARSQFLPLVGKAKQEQISTVLRDRLAPLFRTHRRAAVAYDKELAEEVLRLERQAVADSASYLWILAALSIFSVVVGGLVGLVTANGIVRASGLLLQRVKALAGGPGDLTARIPVETKDELGQLAEGINDVIARIQGIIRKVRESSLQLLSTASQIAATARQQDATVQGLSSSTSEVAAAVREITATSKELSGAMNEVNGRASQAATLAAAGRTRLGGMQQTMSGLVESTASVSAKLSTIREKADSINVIVTTITKVADQTNLLSINAAIEAEKAGEYGRGFLVVAREIRRLADQTAVATLDIENMVKHMHEAVSTGVMQMDKFSDEVRSGVGKVAEINGQTGQIIDQVHAVTDRFHEVNEGMRNQSIGAEQINEAMASMTGNIRQTAAALEEFNRATGHLRSSIEALNSEIGQFKV